MRGVNYFPRETPWSGLWTKTPADIWDKDMALYEIVLAGAEQRQAAGVLAWCLHDYPIKNPNESHFGLVRADGTLKPAALVLRNVYSHWSDP